MLALAGWVHASTPLKSRLRWLAGRFLRCGAGAGAAILHDEARGFDDGTTGYWMKYPAVHVPS